ncbi:MAG: M1 family aminopeptidase [bacterium]
MAPHRRQDRRFVVSAMALVLWACGVAPGFAADPVPLAPVPQEPVWRPEYQIRQHRILEAETKARGYAEFAAREAASGLAKSGAMDAYDVTFYDLDLEVNAVTETIAGTGRMKAAVLADSLTTVQLHLLDNLAVQEVRAAGLPVAYTHAGDILETDLDRTYFQGEFFTVEIDYGGDPAGDYFGWAVARNMPLVWSLSEPYGAREWWPCKDLNTDKADSVDLHVTVQDPLIVASNGLLAGTTVPSPGWTTYHWQERYPIATYLVSVAIHPYAVFSDTYVGLQGQVMPVTNYVTPDLLNTAVNGYAPTVDMIAAFADAFGEYPFIAEKYGHAHFTWGGGMEHQTCSSMYTSLYQESIISHELAHQWWGDMVTCADFGHIWLNEGFATWSEAYWREVSEGVAAYHADMESTRYLGAGSVFVYDPADFRVIFNYYTTYAKASWVVHMLRHVLGDEDFFAALAEYRQQFAFSSATTEDFQGVCESVSGLDLGPFLAQWVYGQYYPVYELSHTSTPVVGGYRLDVRIAQTQTNAGVFTMPLDLRVGTAGGTFDFVIRNDQAVQWYSLEVPFEPQVVELDPDDWVLCEKTAGGISGVLPPAGPLAGLQRAVPNPFNPTTSIRFSLPAGAEVDLTVYDAAGRRVRDLDPGFLPPGEHAVRWDGRDAAGRAAASGAYFVRMRAGAAVSTLPLTLVR